MEYYQKWVRKASTIVKPLEDYRVNFRPHMNGFILLNGGFIGQDILAYTYYKDKEGEMFENYAVFVTADEYFLTYQLHKDGDWHICREAGCYVDNFDKGVKYIDSQSLDSPFYTDLASNAQVRCLSDRGLILPATMTKAQASCLISYLIHYRGRHVPTN